MVGRALTRQWAKQDAVAVVARGQEQPLEGPRPDERRVVRGARAHPHERFGQLELGDLGKRPIGLAKELVDAAGGHAKVEPLLFHRGSHDEAAIVAGN